MGGLRPTRGPGRRSRIERRNTGPGCCASGRRNRRFPVRRRARRSVGWRQRPAVLVSVRGSSYGPTAAGPCCARSRRGLSPLGKLPPEQLAREEINRVLAECGWIVQDYAEMHIGAGPASPSASFLLDTGFVDYLLYASGKVIGVLEAKPAGHTLKGVDHEPGDPRASPRACRAGRPTGRRCRLPTSPRASSRSSPATSTPSRAAARSLPSPHPRGTRPGLATLDRPAPRWPPTDARA